jgi:hypothetical protein
MCPYLMSLQKYHYNNTNGGGSPTSICAREIAVEHFEALDNEETHLLRD